MADQHLQAVLEVRYGVHFNAANERLYRRLKFLFDFSSLFAGSAGVASYVNASPSLAAISGIVLGALAVISLLVSPAEQAIRFNEAYRRFTALDRQSTSMTSEQIRDAVGAIRMDIPWGIDSLGPIAYNRCLEANGYGTGLMETTRWQRFMAWLA